MSQLRRHSALEASLNTASGFLISYAAVWVVYPMLGIETTPSQNFWSVVVFTVISVIRSYIWRRTFNWWQHHKFRVACDHGGLWIYLGDGRTICSKCGKAVTRSCL